MTMLLWLLLAVAAAARAQTVERMRLNFEQDYLFFVNSTIEYIFDFIPEGSEGWWPTRLRLGSAGGEPARPLLLTARQRGAAATWQLPYRDRDGDTLLHQLTRTLCSQGASVDADTSSKCDFVSGESSSVVGAFSLHVSSGCAAPLPLWLRAEPLRDWRLRFRTALSITVNQTAPRAHFYQFEPGQDDVRLIVSSEDEVCATVSVQDYICPVPETLDELSRGGFRMTVMRSGGMQVSRRQFPRGFYVVALVRQSDVPCRGEEEGDSEWLWEAAVHAIDSASHTKSNERQKTLSITIAPALSVREYWIACIVTLVLFLSCYILFLALVLAQRYPPFGRLVAPKAVLADSQNESSESPEHRRRRRGSNATFDSADLSDSDEEGDSTDAPQPQPSNGAQTTNGDTTAGVGASTGATNGTPFGLPAQLTLAALSRRSARTLGARSDRYLHTLCTVAVFYALPVLQFVATFQIVLNVSGSLDLCYYNFLCAHPLGQLADFNHVFSNLGYLLLGALFLLQVRRRRNRRDTRPRDEEYGIPAHYGLLEALGVGMMVVGLLSGCYHVCPNQLNFQFDTSFMYVLSVLCMVKIFQSRHPDINARAHATFAVLAVLIALAVWGVLGGGALFWGIWSVLHVFGFLTLSLRIYYVGQFKLQRADIAAAAAAAADAAAKRRPLYGARLVLLLIANAVNWGFAVYGLVTMDANFPGHLLTVVLGNLLLHMCSYLTMKLLHRERLRWYAWLYIGGAAAAWAPSLYFFAYSSSEWAEPPAESRHRNHECKLLSFYDSHDIWHLLSAFALYLSCGAMLTWDDGLAAVKRTDIPVF